MQNIKNANDIHDFGPNNDINFDRGVFLKGHYWQSGLKISYVDWALSPKYVDGGILYASIKILPDEAGSTPPVPIRTVATDMEWEAEVVYEYQQQHFIIKRMLIF